MIKIPLRILLVEDNEADILITRRAIDKIVEKPEVEVAEDLETCRYQMVHFVPDVVISDYNLPGCNGLDILELVRKKDPYVPFIFLTGTLQDEELAADTILAGAWGFVLKKHMSELGEKLSPLLKKVVFHMGSRDEVRERLRKNKIAINQIYDYLDTVQTDTLEQQQDLSKIRRTIEQFRKDNENHI